jgi:cyclohexa-1,5-dienecarbonyl-CoA hydratase
MSPLLITDEADGSWLRITLNAPPANVVTMAMARELAAELERVRIRADLKLVSIEGAGRHFSYGASIAEHLPPVVHEMMPAFHRLILDLLDVEAPTAAIVRGQCLGGGFELALACDLIFAADDARLGVPEVTLGVFPPAAAALLPLRVGASSAAEAIIGGEARPADWWREVGLVTSVAPADQLDHDVRRWFGCHLQPRSVSALRHAAAASRDVLRESAVPSLRRLEARYLETLVATHDGTEGCAAFVERRPPAWTNR